MRALIVEDSPDDAELIALRLQGEGLEIEWTRVETRAAYLAALDAPPAARPEVILADWSLPRFSGLEALQLMVDRGLDIPFIIVSGSLGEESAVEAMRHGAVDYVLKDRPARLGQSVRRAIAERHVREERRTATAALRQSERRYRALFEGVSEIVFALDRGGRITLLNPFFERVTGWPIHAWIGRPFLDLIAPEDRELALQAWREALKGGPAPYPDLHLLTKDGAPLLVEVAAAVQMAGDQPVELIGFAHDITARVQAEAAARAQYAELEKLHEASQRLLAAALDPEEMYAAVHESVAQLMPCEAFVIVLTEDPDGDVRGQPGTLYAVYLFDKGGRWPSQRLPAEGGLSRYVIAHGETVQIDDYADDDVEAGDSVVQIRHFGASDHVRSILAVPFQSDGRVVGMISTQSYAPHAFNARHRLLLETLAAQFAAAIRNAYLFQQEQARLQEMALIAKVSAALRTARTRADMPPVILEQLIELIEVDGATLEILDPATGALLIELGVGLWAPATGASIPPGEGLSSAVLARGAPYLSNTVQTDPRLFGRDLFEDCQAAAGAPMIADDEVIGLLWIGSRRLLTDHDLSVLTAVADIAANAIRRATYHEQVQAQVRRVHDILETVPEGVMLLDAEGQVLLANPAAARALVALAGAADVDRIVSLGTAPISAFLTRDLEQPWHEVQAGGRFFEIVARPIEVERGSGGGHWVMVIHDATQERAVREQLQRQERLAAVGQLAAGMAHDFNNILAVVVLYAQMVAKEPDLSQGAQGRMWVIQEQAYRATDLIGQILDFSRRAPLDRQPMQLLSLVKEVIKLWERTLPESIAIDLVEDGSPFWIDADPTRIQQVLMNLATNARDAMPEGGRITISLREEAYHREVERPLATLSVGDWVRLDFTDTGAGMTPEVQAHLFEPFFTTKEPGQGTGLGLAQIHGIVKQHGGEVDVASAPGEGTTFSIFLPALAAPHSEHPALSAETEVAGGAGERILVVEDNAVTRTALVDALDSLGYRPVAAVDGHAALAQLADGEAEDEGDPIALIISDLTMPNMGGRALARAVRERGITVPLIVLSGHIRDEEIAELEALGIRRCLRKPIEFQSLGAAVAEVLGRESLNH